MAVSISLAKAPLSYDDRAIEKRVGLILLATDQSSETDFARLVASKQIGVFSTRVAYTNPTTLENLRALTPRLAEAAALILPGQDIDAICFSCTSASVVIGDDVVEAAIRRAKPNVPVVTPGSAAVAALRALGVRRISILTPYTVETSEPMTAYFAAEGFVVESFTCFGLEDDDKMARISRDALIEAAVAATSTEAEALFVSCTALRTAGVIAEIESRIGRPVVSSNQASAWACLNHCHRTAQLDSSAGRLFDLAA